MVTSAAVPAVVGTAMVNTACFLVGATPSRRAHVGELGVVDDDADGLGGIHGGAAADGDDAVSLGGLEGGHAVLHVLRWWGWA